MRLHTILNEGVRFGQKQINEINAYSEDILVGLEYEMHVSQDYIDNPGLIPDVDSSDLEPSEEQIRNARVRVRDRMEEELQRELDGRVHVYRMHVSTLASLAHLVFIIHKELSRFKRQDQDTAERALYNLVTAARWLSDMIDPMKDFVDEFDGDTAPLEVYRTVFEPQDFGYVLRHMKEISKDDVFGGTLEFGGSATSKESEMLDWDEFYSQIMPSSDDMFDSYAEKADMIIKRAEKLFMPIIDTFQLRDSAVPQRAFSDPGGRMTDVLEAEIEDTLARLVIEQLNDMEETGQFDDEAYEEALEIMNQHSSSIVDIAKKMLVSSDLMDSRILNVTTDQSVHKGVEIITNKMPIDQAVEHMRDMFAFMKDWDMYTSNKTGLHVNMSLANEPMDLDHINPVKLMMLLDDDWLTKKYPPREHVRKTMKTDPAAMVSLVRNILQSDDSINVENMNERLLQAVEKATKKQIPMQKFRGVNLLNIVNAEDMTVKSTSPNRIEFRYMGNKDYEEGFELQRFDIYRFAYVMKAAFDDDFLRNDYLRSLAKWLNESFEDMFKMPFIDFLRQFHKVRTMILGSTEGGVGRVSMLEELMSRLTARPRNASNVFEQMMRNLRRDEGEEVPDDPMSSGGIEAIIKANKRELYASFGIVLKDALKMAKEGRPDIDTRVRSLINPRWIVEEMRDFIDEVARQDDFESLQFAARIMDTEIGAILTYYWIGYYGMQRDIIKRRVTTSDPNVRVQFFEAVETEISRFMPEIFKLYKDDLFELKREMAANRL